MNALTLWERRFAKPWKGQQRDKMATWVYDGLWSAACWESAAKGHRAEGREDVAKDYERRAQGALKT